MKLRFLSRTCNAFSRRWQGFPRGIMRQRAPSPSLDTALDTPRMDLVMALGTLSVPFGVCFQLLGFGILAIGTTRHLQESCFLHFLSLYDLSFQSEQ